MTVLFLRGEDVGDRSYWAWEWSDGGEPGFFDIQRTALKQVLGELDRALPGLLDEERDMSAAELRAKLEDGTLLDGLRSGVADILMDAGSKRTNWGDRARRVLMVDRCLTGALSVREDERKLAGKLGELFLPQNLVTEIRTRAEAHSDIEVRILPARSCVRVPWELLVVGGPGDSDERLLDIARVVTMAPLLARDGDTSIPQPDWAQASAYPPLYVIDPALGGTGSVLCEAQAQGWSEQIFGVPRSDGDKGEDPESALGIVRGRADRSWLGRALRRQRSRFIYVGHVEATEGTAGKTALVLGDSKSMYGLGGKSGGMRYLTAQDLYAGTMNREGFFRRLSERSGGSREEAIFNEFGARIQYPEGARDAEGNGIEVPGRDLWPMPPRVALIACHSGTDFAHAEPFGLVVAFLELGAELVTATRWVMLTDLAFQAANEAVSGEPFNSLAHAVDDMQSGEHPNRSLAEWQRKQLRSWRERGTLADSPLWWASVTNYYAPDRTLR